MKYILKINSKEVFSGTYLEMKNYIEENMSNSMGTNELITPYGVVSNVQDSIEYKHLFKKEEKKPNYTNYPTQNRDRNIYPSDLLNADFIEQYVGEEFSDEERREAREEFYDCFGYEVGNEFVFTVHPNEEEYPFFMISPKSYIEREGNMPDIHISPFINLPPGFGESMEATFEYDGSIEQGIKVLLDNGFIFDEDIQNSDYEGSEARLENGMTVSEYVNSLI
jgi:hypothetical protein